jgi:Mrp family chromosome partitioning ATPase
LSSGGGSTASKKDGLNRRGEALTVDDKHTVVRAVDAQQLRAARPRSAGRRRLFRLSADNQPIESPRRFVVAPAPRPVREADGTDRLHIAEQLISFNAPNSFAADQYRALRYTVERLRHEFGLQVLAVSSPAPGDGKTVTTLNLAGAIAQSPSARLLVVDADHLPQGWSEWKHHDLEVATITVPPRYGRVRFFPPLIRVSLSCDRRSPRVA